ncbi:hypothetical protein ACPPVU_04710 [Mucilaginibacter sp. McL0603]|uniref:hypothetical protein n=1 Tax=Mucilaginibacter sp. McL0603 TaxID=3415670 RepID=UPI003CE7828E
MDNLDRLIEIRDELSTFEDADRSSFERIHQLIKEAINISVSLNHSLHTLEIGDLIDKLKDSFTELDSFTNKEFAIHEAYAYLIYDINGIITAVNIYLGQHS